MMYSRLFVPASLISFLLMVGLVSAQTPITFRGVVMDAETGTPLSFATVALNSRTAGALTDTLGRFSFRATPIAGDSLQITYVGYSTQSFALNDKSEQVFHIKLSAATGLLDEVVITADPSPGKTLMKKVLARNRQNNPARFERLDARRWTRSEVSALDPIAASDPSNKTAARGGMLFGSRVRAFEKVRPADDTLRGQTPLFFAEKLGNYTLINHPFTENERTIAVKITGLESDKMLEPLARWDAGSVNMYDARVMLFSKAFVSPIGPEALSFYDFYIVDSTTLPNGYHSIILQPIPKVWHGNVFTGRIAVEDSAYALIAADLRLSKDANLNYIESLSLHQTFQPAFDYANGRTAMVPYESTLTLRYEAGLDLLGIPLPANADSKRLISRMSAVFDSVRVNDPKSNAVTAGGMVSTVRSQDSGASDGFWNQNRPDSLSSHEVAIYRMADAIRNDPRQRFKDQLFSTIGTGAYYIHDKVYLGPIGTLVSFNKIEGARLRVGFRTQEGFSKNVGLNGHVAYGTRDKQFKGSLGVKYLWNTQPYAKTEVHAGSDYNAISQWYDEIDADGFINSLLRKNVPYYQTFQTQLTLSHDQQMGANWFVKGGLAYRTISPSFDFNYPNPDFRGNDITPSEPTAAHSIPVAQASVALRFAWHERSRIFDYERLPTGSKFPSIALIYTQGFRFSGADFVFEKLNIDISHTTRLTPKAALIWNLDAGKIFGTLPSLLLQVPRGNDAYVMSRYVFNTMQPYEFAADRYLSLQTRLALGGMLFDRVPLLQKLGWRERLTFNTFWGDLSQSNHDFNEAQQLIAPNKKPFMEAGIGVENIFHLFSIDYVKRLNYLDSPGAAGNRSGVFLGMKVVF
ncbi:MAG: DUF5686 family protein [Saprospiraceae bacterium]|nr:DUF5686 family protein [Saprospiraceae bacterium]